jgi:hypothetical protein
MTPLPRRQQPERGSLVFHLYRKACHDFLRFTSLLATPWTREVVDAFLTLSLLLPHQYLCYSCALLPSCWPLLDSCAIVIVAALSPRSSGSTSPSKHSPLRNSARTTSNDALPHRPQHAPRPHQRPNIHVPVPRHNRRHHHPLDRKLDPSQYRPQYLRPHNNKHRPRQFSTTTGHRDEPPDLKRHLHHPREHDQQLRHGLRARRRHGHGHNTGHQRDLRARAGRLQPQHE